MKKAIIITLLMATGAFVKLPAQPSMDASAAYKAADEILDKMTVEERLCWSAGKTNSSYMVSRTSEYVLCICPTQVWE